MKGLAGGIAIMTGAGGAIGRAIAERSGTPVLTKFRTAVGRRSCTNQAGQPAN